MKKRLGLDGLVVCCVMNAAQLRAYARKVPPDCDMLEVRLDAIGWNAEQWKTDCGRIQRQGMPVLLTIRLAKEGGHWVGPESVRMQLFQEGYPFVSAVDVEISARQAGQMMGTAHQAGRQVVGSFHDFEKTPSLAKLKQVEKRGRRLGADVVKMAFLMKRPEDEQTAAAMLSSASGPISIQGMGKRGLATRIPFARYGSCLVYGSLGRPAVSLQPTCRRLYRELHPPVRSCLNW
ncbi:MAG: type I 3-dehydroquinate dehydratase [Verrucomicrobiota bacterium]|jgi:3-dehydroquinate dehydratase type I|nr:type I 3-dehydroquinate dehydratase [Verrucomicrobiota bacterium]